MGQVLQRSEHFQLFSKMQLPHFSLTAALDITPLQAFIKRERLPHFATVLYYAAHAMQPIPEFRTRLRSSETIIQLPHHIPSWTVPWKGELFNFAKTDLITSQEQFRASVLQASSQAAKAPHLILDPTDELLYVTCFPWATLTGVQHPIANFQSDSIPRLAWSKPQELSSRTLLYVNIQAHHGLVDGRHAGRVFQQLEAFAQDLPNEIPLA